LVEIYFIDKMPIKKVENALGLILPSNKIYIKNSIPLLIKIFVLIHEFGHYINDKIHRLLFRMRAPFVIHSCLIKLWVKFEEHSALICRKWM